MKKKRDIIQFEIIIIAVFTMEPKYFESRVYIFFFKTYKIQIVNSFRTKS